MHHVLMSAASSDTIAADLDVERMLEVMMRLPMVSTLARLASALGWPASRRDAAIDAAGNRVQIWGECPDGPSIVLGAIEVMERGLEGSDDGRWIRPGKIRLTGRKAGLRTYRESELNARPDEEGLAEMVADDSPSPLDALIAAEDLAGPGRDDGARRGRPSDLGRLSTTISGSAAHFVTLIGVGQTWFGENFRMVGTDKVWQGRRVDGRKFVVDRGEIVETARVAPRCPGCNGAELGPAVFCLRCSRPPAITPPSGRARRLREDFDEAPRKRKDSIREVLKAPAIVEVELAGSVG
jgi:hypothetical protein